MTSRLDVARSTRREHRQPRSPGAERLRSWLRRRIGSSQFAASAVTPPERSALQDELRLWPFDLPYPSRISLLRDRVTAHSRNWVQQVGLAVGEEALRRHDRHDMALFACLSYPDATEGGLDLISDWVSWWSIWNDFPDDPAFVNESGRAERFFGSLTSVVAPPVQQPAPAPDDVHSIAFADVWRRWCQGMSPAFIARTRMNWVDWFASYLTRCEQRRKGRIPSVKDYLALRDLTGAARLEMDAAQRASGYEVPPEILDSDLLQAMQLITMRVINITQDVQSLAKEEAAGDHHNMVIVLQAQRGLTREDALLLIHVLIREYTDSFGRHEANIPQFLDTLAIPVEQRSPVYRFAADLRSLMRGCVDFCAASGRYK